ncbi:hypothetical protein ACRALDRAFT_212507 [Sodiomyces alcalophilus JCM 7366]|uniref:uncharacterized protein n=1 Tax=Sodiomyces alcalophilus JCM 7366 TaxID=591952 RepID=UPI0039B5F33D
MERNMVKMKYVHEKNKDAMSDGDEYLALSWMFGSASPCLGEVEASGLDSPVARLLLLEDERHEKWPRGNVQLPTRPGSSPFSSLFCDVLRDEEAGTIILVPYMNHFFGNPTSNYCTNEGCRLDEGRISSIEASPLAIRPNYRYHAVICIRSPHRTALRGYSIYFTTSRITTGPRSGPLLRNQPPFSTSPSPYTSTAPKPPVFTTAPNRAYKNLSPKTRIAVGFGIIGWGTLGLWLSDRAEEKYQPPEEDKAAVERYIPRISVVDSCARKTKPFKASDLFYIKGGETAGERTFPFTQLISCLKYFERSAKKDPRIRMYEASTNPVILHKGLIIPKLAARGRVQPSPLRIMTSFSPERLSRPPNGSFPPLSDDKSIVIA